MNDGDKENVLNDEHIIRRRTPLFFPVSKTKLFIMSVFTFGIYEIYWFYQNWKLVKERTGQEMRPFWRSIFSIIFCHSFFKSVKETADVNKIPLTIGPGLLAFFYIILYFTWKLPDPLSYISFLTVLPLMHIQTVANDINERNAPDVEPNNRFSAKNIIAIIFGIVVLILGLLPESMLK